MTLTLIFALPTSAASARVKPAFALDSNFNERTIVTPKNLPITPALLAAYPALPVPPFTPSNEETLMIQPVSPHQPPFPTLLLTSATKTSVPLEHTSFPEHPLPNYPTSQHRPHQVRLHDLPQRLHARDEKRRVMRDACGVH